MAKIETLMASMNKAEEKVEKCGKTIERHHKALAKKAAIIEELGYNANYSEVDFNIKLSYEFEKQLSHIDNQRWDADGRPLENRDDIWAIFDVISKLKDIHGATRKLAEAEKILSNWKVKVVAEQTKVDFASSAPKVIIDFVNAWGEMAFDWMMANLNHPNEDNVRRNIENDKQIKIIQLTMRVTDVVGTITDASQLDVGEKGDLIGVIHGEKGSARLETISAGGWNIQCYHYRTVVHSI